MTYAPATLVDLGRYWVAQGGINLGIVGDTSHQAKGVSYHLGKGQLTATAYSRRTSRDRAGLTEAASAIDLGRLDKKLTDLRAFSVWLVDQARHDRPGTADMREIIYSPDGKVVLRWDRERGYPSKPQGGEADTSHLTHTHISWYRDAEKRDHTTAFRPYFEGDDMAGDWKITVQSTGVFTCTTPHGAGWIHPDTGVVTAMPAGTRADLMADVQVGWKWDAPGYLCSGGSPHGRIVLKADGVLDPPLPDGAAAERERIAEAEADRIRAI